MRDLPSHDKFLDYISYFKNDIVLITHTQADPDAVGSVIALTHYIHQVNPNLEIYTLNRDISLLGKKLLQNANFNLKLIKKDQIKPSTLCIFLDTSEVITELQDLNNKIAIFDHHIISPLNTQIDFDFRQKSFLSTSEIIATLYYHTKVNLSSQAIIGLLAGIIFDTRRFRYSDYELFECINFLLRNDPDSYSQALTLFSSSRSKAEKIACIRAAQRMKRYSISNFNILFSNVSSFEAAAARSLISLGGDVAMVIAKKKKEIRISFRTAPEFSTITGISIGLDIIPALIKKFGGTGGGHDEAAGYNNETGEMEKIKDYVFQLLGDLLH